MTSSQAQIISNHYTVSELEKRILSSLIEAGKNIENLSVDDLAPVDEFHIRGRLATEELASWTNLQSDDNLLDVGCGLGGTGRFLAKHYQCHVTGVDLTDEYCRVATTLSARVGLQDQTTFRQGSALDLQFADNQFDVVWTEHVQMNIQDKAQFYGELRRVLAKDGRLAFHDIFAGNEKTLHFPVPWASEPSISHLISVGNLELLLAELGLTKVQWEDKTIASADFFRGVLKRIQSEGWMPLGLHLLMGNDAETKFANVLRNLEENRMQVIQAVMKFTDP